MPDIKIFFESDISSFSFCHGSTFPCSSTELCRLRVDKALGDAVGIS